MLTRLLRKLGVGDAKADGQAAVEQAEAELRRAQLQAEQVRPITDKLRAHADRNHIGERINLAWRRAG